MKTVVERAKRFKLAKPYWNILFFVCALLISDTVIALLAGPYLSQNVITFLGKSDLSILSDFLFLEGAAIFAIGSFIAFGRSTWEIRRYSKKSRETSAEAKVSTVSAKRTHRDIVMMIIGALLLGLSVIFGAVFG